MAKYVPRGNYLAELALLKPNKSFGTYKRDEYVSNETKRPAPVSSSLRKKRYRQEEDIRTDYSRVEDIEEFNLPAPIPDLPPFQPESCNVMLERTRIYFPVFSIFNHEEGTFYELFLRL